MSVTDDEVGLARVSTENRRVDGRTAPPELEEPATRRTPGRRRALAIKATLVLIDALALVITVFASFFVVDLFFAWSPGAIANHLRTALISVPFQLVAIARFRLYQARFISTRLMEWRRLLNAVGVGAMGMLVINTALGRPSLHRLWLVAVTLLSLVVLMAAREGVRQTFGRMRSVGRFRRRVVIVGDNLEAMELRAMMDADPSLGYEFGGYLSVYDEPSKHVHPDDVVGSIENATQVIELLDVDHVVVAGSAIKMDTTKGLSRRLLDSGVHLELSPTLPDIDSERLTIRSLGRFPVVYLEPHSQDGWRAFAKRVFDMAMASCGLLALAPLMIATAIAVRIDSPGPIFYRQSRVGQRGDPFDMIKFRSMVTNAHEMRDELTDKNESDGPLFKMAEDPRITRVGRIIRKLSLDELPQLWNVVIGDMGLVGPRPALPEEAEQWPTELRNRLRVKPGITGMWQVSGRSDTGFDEYSRLDLYYVDNWSLLTDLTILARTVPIVLSGRGAS